MVMGCAGNSGCLMILDPVRFSPLSACSCFRRLGHHRFRRPYDVLRMRGDEGSSSDVVVYNGGNGELGLEGQDESLDEWNAEPVLEPLGARGRRKYEERLESLAESSWSDEKSSSSPVV